jgi:hypothetical protein
MSLERRISRLEQRTRGVSAGERGRWLRLVQECIGEPDEPMLPLADDAPAWAAKLHCQLATMTTGMYLTDPTITTDDVLSPL